MKKDSLKLSFDSFKKASLTSKTTDQLKGGRVVSFLCSYTTPDGDVIKCDDSLDDI